jgi:hypothetical protein
MKHKELTGKIIECAYQVYKKRLASFVYPACGSEVYPVKPICFFCLTGADIPLIGAEAKFTPPAP